MAYRTYRSTYSFGFGYGLTPAVKKLLIANVAAFFFTVIGQAIGLGSFIGWLMLTPYAVTHQLAVWQLVTYMFLHGGFFHILFNMFALWMFGGELERTWGTRRFLHYYFLTGIGAGLFSVLASPSSPIPTVGASGAIYGILLAYGILFPNRIIYIPILLILWIPIPAKFLVMILGGIAFVSALSGPGDLVNHVAHLGGMAVGFLYLRGRPFYFDFRNRYYRWRRLRLQRQFEVYMKKRDGQQRPRGPSVQ
ncbi:MAG: hypothetical protein A3H27_02425 [Acidobacteria bacterium RIFCSPLOWO2_02_FULL_59_13]|nr:MAG: hypothetical protein A3H27_02425 [Acidobacteria bacterium RIFCSPLOWO2_02_FULL_59_13]